MNNNINNFPTPLPGVWRTGVRAYDTHSPTNSDSYEVPVLYRTRSFQPNPDDWSGALDPQRMVGSRRPSGLYTMPDFPGQPRSRPQRIYVLNGAMGRGLNPRFRGIAQQSTPRSRGQTNMQVPTEAPNFRSTALSKLKKEVYNPAPKQLARRLSSYYKDKAANNSKEWEKEKDEDGKRCAVCLEDFEPKEEVMLTKCDHMFHEDCIVPWVTSNGHCPVCRFVICERERERERENPSPFNINNIANMTPSDILAGELFSILRAMEENFQLGNATH